MFSRRAFLGTSMLGLSAAHVLGQDKGPEPAKHVEDAAFQPATLFLTWHRDPTTTMVIQWVGAKGETADTNVYYAEAGDEEFDGALTSTRPYPLTDLQIFRCELTDLTPGSEYRFKIGKSSPTWKFKTMPAKATNAIQFVTGGDVGINAHAVANNISAAKQDPAFCFIGGDLGYDNGRSVEVSLAFLRQYSRHMITRDGRLIPLIACLGNHEVDGGYGKPRSKAPFFYALFDGLFPEVGYNCLDFGDYLSLVMLDTGHTSKIAGEQTDWLEQTLRARVERPHVIVAGHVPAYPSFRKMDPTVINKTGTGEEQRKHWVPLYEKYRVPVVLEHHDHTFKRTKALLGGHAHDNGVVYLGDGSWGRLRTPGKPEKMPHMAVVGRDYQVSIHRLQGDDRFHLALDENGRIMDACHTAQRKRGAVLVSG
ncbi:MAG: metallophosphoesterase family protein [Gemmataceae bacterium]|nr:metallophosphoesterase family protein [Gemmataceae bacterium]